MAPPIVIAHRGASGYLPEHTLVAKALAHGLGADYLEQDIVATRDSALVVLHDLYLDDVTDVAQRFPGRRRDDGRHYVVDFDLAELQTLTVFERRASQSTAAKYPARFPNDSGLYGGIVSLRQELELIRGLNRSTARAVGVYPEIKEPAWHRRHGIDLGRLVLDELRAFGYWRTEDPAFVQCFDHAELRRLKHELRCELRLIQLLGPEPPYADLCTPSGLRAIAAIAYGVGPHFSQLVELAEGQPRPSDFAERVRDAGLRVHAYTFRREDVPTYARTLEELLEIFLGRIGIEGVFCDHPDVAVRVRASLLEVQGSRKIP